jgi:transposase
LRLCGDLHKRKGHDGLVSLVRRSGGEVFSGYLFVFLSRRADRVKILGWDRGGFVLWYKRLERGRFKWPRIEAGVRSVELDAGQLAMLLDGIDYTRVRRPPRWQPPQIANDGIDKNPRA